MAAGPLARLVAQVLVMGFNVFTRAFVQAYQQAAANPNGAKQAAANAQRTLRKEMTKDEALKVLNFESMPKTADELKARYDRYYNANAPEKGGSFYLQSKFFRAREAVEKQLAEEAAAAGGAPAGGEAAAKDKDGKN